MWTFLNPMFLYALAAGLIPLVLHLLKRRQAVIVHFSTLRFLKLAQKKSSRRMRMENFLLWLLRTILLLLLAMAFALPVIRSTGFGTFMGRSQRDVAIIWDVSASMDYSSGQKKTWEESRDVVLGILKGLQKGDRVTIHLAGEDVTPLIGEPSGDLDLAVSQVKTTQFRPTSSRLPPAVTAACQALQNSGKREREVYIVTDGQSLPWREFGGALAAAAAAATTNAPADAGKSNATEVAKSAASSNSTKAATTTWNPKNWEKDYTFFVTLVGPLAPANTGILDVDVQPHLLMENSPANVSVKLGQFGEAGETSLSLFIDDKEAGRLAVNESTSGALVFPLPPLTKGVHSARVECQPDGYALDNALHFLLRLRERLPVLVVAPEDAAFFVKRALNPGGDAAGTIDAKLVAPDAVASGDLQKYSCVILCDAFPLPGALLLEVEQFARQGGLVIIFPGDRAGAADYANANFMPAKVVKIDDTVDAGVRSLLRLVQPQDPIFSSLKFPPGSVPAVNMKRRLTWTEPQPESEVLVTTQGDQPFLQSRKFGKGRVLVFSVSGERGWSNLPLSPYFLPFLHQMVEFGAGMTREPLYVWQEKDLSLPAGMAGFADVTSLKSPAGDAVPVRLVRGEGGIDSIRIEGLPGPGVYTSTTGAEPVPTLAVNARREESDLTTLKNEDALAALGLEHAFVARDGAELARLVDSHRVGRPMAELLLWLAAIVAIVELFFANRACKSGKKLSDSMSVDLSGRVKVKAES